MTLDLGLRNKLACAARRSASEGTSRDAEKAAPKLQGKVIPQQNAITQDPFGKPISMMWSILFLPGSILVLSACGTDAAGTQQIPVQDGPPKKAARPSWLLMAAMALSFACVPVKNSSDGSSGLRVVGGDEATPHAYPFVVSVFHENERKTYCGGSLIAPNVVLTAAHCFKDYWFPKSKFLVRIGKHHMYMFEDGEELMKIDKIVMHDGFSSTTLGLENDIALVFLKEPSKFSPIKLNRDPQFPSPGSLQRVVGWGTIDEIIHQGQQSLREVDLPIVDNKTCASLNPGIDINDYQICTGYLDGVTEKSPCKGDSGGPLFSAEGDKSLIGIVSGARGCARPNIPAFYTRVSSFIGWIEERTGPLPR